MKPLALVTCFLLPAGVLLAAPRGGGFSSRVRAGGSNFSARVNSGSRASSASRTNSRSSTTGRSSASKIAITGSSSSGASSSTGASSTGSSMAGGCMNSTSTGTRTTGTTTSGTGTSGTITLGTSSLGTIGFGGTTTAGYGMYVGNSVGYGCAGNACNTNGHNNGSNSNGFNSSNLNLFGQGAGGNAALARLNPQQAQKQIAPAADVPDSPPLDLPSRSWTSDGGEVVVEGQFVGLLDGKVIVRKPVGSILLLSLDQLSDTDRQYVSSVAGHKATPTVAASE